MTIEQLKNLHQATPFRPFTLHLADGRQVPVPHRDFLSHSPSGRTVIVYGPGESFDVIDPLVVTSLHVQEANGSGKRRRT